MRRLSAVLAFRCKLGSPCHRDERARIVRMFHDEVSSTMLAVLFAIESAKDELEAQNLPQAETVAKASELLQEVVEKISEVLEDKKGR